MAREEIERRREEGRSVEVELVMRDKDVQGQQRRAKIGEGRTSSMLVAWALSFFAVIHKGSTARILGIAPIPSYSHQVVYQPLWRDLSLRGHQVTTLTTDPIKDPKLINLTEIDLHFSYEMYNNAIEIISNRHHHSLRVMGNLWEQSIKMTHQQLSHPSVQTLIHGDDRFDAIIMEVAMPAMCAFAAKFKCPLIAIASFDGSPIVQQIMGNPGHPTLYPYTYFPYDKQLTFSERIGSFLLTCLLKVCAININNESNKIAHKYFGPNYPPTSDIIQNISMVFVNSNPIFRNIRPIVPTVIQIGGDSHIKPPKPLPSDLQTLLDGASQGFIYFSLGSNVKCRDIPIETRTKILETFAELPYKIVWKFEEEKLPNKPENVFISKWLPQQDILRHPNIKLFVTQGGLQSAEEALYSGVPMIVIPIMFDQGSNCMAIVYKGMGLAIDYTNFDKQELKWKILEVIHNPIYRNKVKELAKLSLDQPMTGLERAVWWTEYVIRHKGADHLRSPLKALPWHQYLLLDVVTVFVITFIVLAYVIYLIIRTLWHFLKPKSKWAEKKIN